ncbi:hypothetical protein FACS1894125_2480 [Actinomycetota bacterium]|nr:hypothetical protein FACS1894125_2480 [Actinomycetota bacterium]
MAIYSLKEKKLEFKVSPLEVSAKIGASNSNVLIDVLTATKTDELRDALDLVITGTGENPAELLEVPALVKPCPGLVIIPQPAKLFAVRIRSVEKKAFAGGSKLTVAVKLKNAQEDIIQQTNVDVSGLKNYDFAIFEIDEAQNNFSISPCALSDSAPVIPARTALDDSTDIQESGGGLSELSSRTRDVIREIVGRATVTSAQQKQISVGIDGSASFRQYVTPENLGAVLDMIVAISDVFEKDKVLDIEIISNEVESISVVQGENFSQNVIDEISKLPVSIGMNVPKSSFFDKATSEQYRYLITDSFPEDVEKLDDLHIILLTPNYHENKLFENTTQIETSINSLSIRGKVSAGDSRSEKYLFGLTKSLITKMLKAESAGK